MPQELVTWLGAAVTAAGLLARVIVKWETRHARNAEQDEHFLSKAHEAVMGNVQSLIEANQQLTQINHATIETLREQIRRMEDRQAVLEALLVAEQGRSAALAAEVQTLRDKMSRGRTSREGGK